MHSDWIRTRKAQIRALFGQWKIYASSWFNREVLGCNEEDTYERLVSNKVSYYKSCYSKYNQHMLNKVLDRIL